MAVLEKFHQKNKSIFGKIEVTSDTYIAPAATDALPVLTISGSITNETGSYEYLGDLLSRDEYSYLKDQFADFQAETPQQTLGTLNGALAVVDAPLSEWFQAVGGYVTVLSSALGSFAAGTVFVDNSQVSDSSLSVDYRQSSSQDSTVQKLRKFTACRGMVDVSASVGDVPKLKFSMKGNASDPIQALTLTPIFGNQFVNVASPVRNTTIANAEIASSDGTFTAFGGTISTITKAANIATATTAAPHSLGANGTIRFINIAGATDSLYNGLHMITITSTTTFIYVMSATPAANASGTFTATVGPASKSFCFNTLTAANFFGFDIARYQTGCEVGFDKKAVPSDVSVSILELPSPKTVVTAISSTTTTATVTAKSHGLIAGDSITIAVGMTQYDGTFTVLAGGLTADAFTYTIASYSGSFTGAGVVTNNSYSKFDPDSNISKFFGAQVKFGTAAGNYVTYKWDKLQVKDSKEGTVGNYLGRDVAFRNTGRSFIILE